MVQWIAIAQWTIFYLRIENNSTWKKYQSSQVQQAPSRNIQTLGVSNTIKNELNFEYKFNDYQQLCFLPTRK